MVFVTIKTHNAVEVQVEGYSHRADTPTEKDRDLKFKNTQLKISLKQQWQFQNVFEIMMFMNLKCTKSATNFNT